MDSFYHFNATQLRAQLDADLLHGDSVDAPSRVFVTLANGDVYHVGGTWLDDDNNNAEDQNDD